MKRGKVSNTLRLPKSVALKHNNQRKKRTMTMTSLVASFIYKIYFCLLSKTKIFCNPVSIEYLFTCVMQISTFGDIQRYHDIINNLYGNN